MFSAVALPSWFFKNYTKRLVYGNHLLLVIPLQRACYLSVNPQKDETLETEKAQYYLPDGSTIEVGEDLGQMLFEVEIKCCPISLNDYTADQRTLWEFL